MASLKPLGYVLYDGPSAYDGEPVITILLPPKNGNVKIGRMWQTFHLLRDVKPTDALKTGQDSSVCGECPLRPITARAAATALCYVNVGQSVGSIWRAYQRGRYELITPEAARELLQGESLRAGAYGDPASMPYPIWVRLGMGSGEFQNTGYIHGWLLDNFDSRLTEFMMVSLDPISEKLHADKLPKNARTYRVLADGEQPRSNEILCPYYTHGTKCADCGLCAGSQQQAKSIVAPDHGPTSKFRRVARAA
jgi:hypothetical protein